MLNIPDITIEYLVKLVEKTKKKYPDMAALLVPTLWRPSFAKNIGYIKIADPVYMQGLRIVFYPDISLPMPIDSASLHRYLNHGYIMQEASIKVVSSEFSKYLQSIR